MINTFSQSRTSDRYWFKDYQEVIRKEPKVASSPNSLCINCSDYYEIPPCQTNFGSDRGCFPSLRTNQENFN